MPDEITVLADIRPPHKANYPFYPLTDEGMPLPGPDFIAQAVALGDPEPVFSDGPVRYRTLVSHGPMLHQLYYNALYDPSFNIPIKVKGRTVTTTFIRGHLWGYAPSGPRGAKVMVVGKWPGQEEVQLGRNFAGPSGQVTVRSLEAAGLTADTFSKWYISNVIHHPNLDPSSTTAAKAWLKNCAILLEQELRLVKPDYILALGAEATKALLGDDMKVDSAQGQVFEKKIRVSRPGFPAEYRTAQVMVCIHPARVARTPDKLPEFNTTTRRFVRLLRGEDLDTGDEAVDHRAIYKERDLAQLIDEIIEEGKREKDPQIIAIDGEWHGEYPTEPGSWLRTVQFSHKKGFAAAVVIRKCGGDYAFIPSDPATSVEEAVARQLKRLLINTPTRRVRIAGHNLRADLPWIYHGLDKELGKALIDQFVGPKDVEATRTEGGFDTMMAAHAVTEAPGEAGFKLEVLSLNVCGVRRYDNKLQSWKTQYCRDNDLKAKDLEGYGMCPDEVLVGEPYEDPTVTIGTPVKDSYACWDADSTRRLVDAYNRPGGLLDKDQYGNSSRRPFHVSMRAISGFLEMEMNGLMIDTKRGDHLTDIFMEAKKDLLDKLQDMIKWPGFNPSSSQQCITLLFGAQYAGKIDKETGETLDPAPPGAMRLGLYPIKTSGKPSRQWDQVERRHQTDMYRPSTDKEVLGILVARLAQEDKAKADIVQTLRYIRFAKQVLQGMLREPIRDPVTGLPELDEEDNRTYEGGLLSFVHSDRRVRTHIFPTKETRRCATARPSLQNLSKRRETDYKKILGPRYCYPLRSVVTASPGYVLVESDYMGAELAMMAIQARSAAMIDHCMRANYPESDPRHYDIHSNMAVMAFQLKVNDFVSDPKDGLKCYERLKLPLGAPLPATKSALKAAGYENLRTAAKTIMFGVPYGRGIEAVVRAIEEEGVFITVQDGESIRASIFEAYPELPVFFEECEKCVANPGYMVNCCGGIRRFQHTGLEDGGELKRQARNLLIQGGVADMVNIAIDNLYHYPDRWTSDGQLKYRLLLQIHDAIFFEVMPRYLEWFIGTPEEPGVVSQCMTQGVPVYACTPDGTRIPGMQPYYMGTETEVMQYWGVKIPLEVGEQLGVPARFCKKPDKK